MPVIFKLRTQATNAGLGSGGPDGAAGAGLAVRAGGGVCSAGALAAGGGGAGGVCVGAIALGGAAGAVAGWAVGGVLTAVGVFAAELVDAATAFDGAFWGGAGFDARSRADAGSVCFALNFVYAK